MTGKSLSRNWFLAFCVAYWGKASSHPAAQAVISCWFRAAAQAGSAVAQVNQRVFKFFFYYFVERFRFYGSKSGRSGATRQEEVEDFGESEA